MNNRESAALDRYITGNYGEDQFRNSRPATYQERKREFLESLTMDAISLNHNPFPWNKGAHGFHTHCRKCGVMMRCNVSTFTVKEFPTDECTGENQ